MEDQYSVPDCTVSHPWRQSSFN